MAVLAGIVDPSSHVAATLKVWRLHLAGNAVDALIARVMRAHG